MKQAVYEMQHQQDRVSAPEGSLAGLMKQKDQLAGLVSGKTNALFVISSAGPSEGRVGACKGVELVRSRRTSARGSLEGMLPKLHFISANVS